MTKNINQLMLAAFPYKEDRVECFIDGSNLHAALKKLNIAVDYGKIADLIKSYAKLIRLSYYTALLPDKEEHNPLKPLVDWLSYNGYNLVTKDAKVFVDEDTKKEWIKGNIDVDLAVDAMIAAKYIDHAVLFTGDGDFKSLVQALQNQRIRVTVISTIRTTPSMCADELRKQCDAFIDLADIADAIRR